MYARVYIEPNRLSYKQLVLSSGNDPFILSLTVTIMAQAKNQNSKPDYQFF